MKIIYKYNCCNYIRPGRFDIKHILHDVRQKQQGWGRVEANLLYRACFRNNLPKRVRFKTNQRQGLLWTWVPPLTSAGSLNRQWQQRPQCIPPFLLAGHGDQERDGHPSRHSSWRDMADEERGSHAATGTGGTCQRGQSRHCLLRNTLKASAALFRRR